MAGDLELNSDLIENPIRDEHGRLKKGVVLNPNGRPKGSLSVIGRLKQMFEENPEEFEEFVKSYKADPANRKHITEMIDGKPKQDIDANIKGDINITIVKYE